MKEKERHSYKKRILIAVLSVLSVVLLGTAALFSTEAKADDDEDKKQELIDDGWEYGKTDALNKEYNFFQSMDDEEYNEILTHIEKQHKEFSRLNTIFSTEGPSAENEYTPSLLWSLMEAENSPIKMGREAIMAMGVVLVLLYGVIEMIKILQRDMNAPVETIIKLLIMCVIGILAVVYIYDILTVIEDLGNLITNAVGKSMSLYAGSEVTYEKIKTVEDQHAPITAGSSLGIVNWFRTAKAATINWSSNLWDDIKQGFHSAWVGVISDLGLCITFYSIITGAYGLVFEMLIRKMFMPIAMADLLAEGMRSPAVRYLKSYFGIYIRIAMFYFLTYMMMYMDVWASDTANISNSHSMNGFLGPIGVVMCVRMAVKALMNASGGLAKEVMGD